MKNNKLNSLIFWTLKVFAHVYMTFKMERKTPKILEVNTKDLKEKPLFDIKNSF